jgi:hypothetical protein
MFVSSSCLRLQGQKVNCVRAREISEKINGIADWFRLMDYSWGIVVAIVCKADGSMNAFLHLRLLNSSEIDLGQ